MNMKFLLLVPFALATQAQAAAVLASGAIGYAYDSVSAPTYQTVLLPDGSLATVLVASGSSQVQSTGYSSPWAAHIGVTATGTSGQLLGSALSLFAVNQMLSGPTTSVPVTYTFSYDGTFSPGNPALYPPVGASTNTPQQNVTLYLTGYYGTALDASLTSDVGGPDLLFDASNGQYTLDRITGAAGFLDTITPNIIPGAYYAACSGGDTRCTAGGAFADTATITFDAPVGASYYIAGYLGGTTDGSIDFLHTVKLQSIAVPEGYTLSSDDNGALSRSGDGIYFLTGSVPEPRIWALFLVGFGAIGLAMRRRPTAGRKEATWCWVPTLGERTFGRTNCSDSCRQQS